MDYRKTVMLSLVVLIMAVGAISTAVAMNGNGDTNKGGDVLRLREQSRINQSVDDLSVMMDEGDEAPKPETQYDRGAMNTEHETERLRPNGTGDNCPKAP
jgi:hypothetical protein